MSGGYGTDALDIVVVSSGSGGTPSLTAAVQLCNSALILLGQEQIGSLGDPSEAARICKTKWPAVRDAFLRKYTWRCLVKREELARMEEVPAFGFLYAYQLPVDYYRLLEFSVAEAAWSIEGKTLLTDETRAMIRYVGYDTSLDNAGLFDPLLFAAIVARLAVEMAPALKSADRGKELKEDARIALNEAKAAGLWEAPAKIVTVTTLLDVR